MKIRLLALLTLVSAIIYVSCRTEEALDPNSIFDGNSTTVENDFDVWIYNNFTAKYNISLTYRLDDEETDMEYNLSPADYTKSIALAQIVKYVWIEAYDEHVGEEFMKIYCPKQLMFVGSPAYNDGSIVLGTAEGGLKVTLYNVNYLNLSSINMTTLNTYYFKTMHHEFAHILHQTVLYPTDYATINPSDYTSTSWLNISDSEARDIGFITAYASSEVNEDFVELYANYVTKTEAEWDSMISSAATYGQEILEAKLLILRSYFEDTWNIDIDEMRAIVQARQNEVVTWSEEYLSTLN